MPFKCVLNTTIERSVFVN